MKKILTLISVLAAQCLLADANLGMNSEKTISVYQKGIAYITEKEKVSLKQGNTSIVYHNIPSKIITDSITVNFNDKVSILTQDYFFNTPNLNNVLKQYIGKEVMYINDKIEKSGYEKGKLLSINGDSVLIESTVSSMVVSVPAKSVSVAKLPENMYLNPFLLWKTQPQKSDYSDTVSIHYLSNGFNWTSEYNAKILNDTQFLLNGWINLSNFSGVDYKNITLNVVAGDVNVAEKQKRNKSDKMELMAAKSMIAEDSVREIQASDVSGYKLYEIPFKVSLNDNQNTQIQFFNTVVDYKMNNVFSDNLYDNQMVKNINAHQFIKFKNKTEKAIPEGTVRFYNENLFIGSSHLENTTTGMEKELFIGKNFNIFMNTKIEKNDVFKNAVLNGKMCKTLQDKVKEYTITNNEKKESFVVIKYNDYYDNEIKILDNSDFKVIDIDRNVKEIRGTMKEKSEATFKVNFKTCVQG